DPPQKEPELLKNRPHLFQILLPYPRRALRGPLSHVLLFLHGLLEKQGPLLVPGLRVGPSPGRPRRRSRPSSAARHHWWPLACPAAAGNRCAVAGTCRNCSSLTSSWIKDPGQSLSEFQQQPPGVEHPAQATLRGGHHAAGPLVTSHGGHREVAALLDL